jgi:hypothetical protein
MNHQGIENQNHNQKVGVQLSTRALTYYMWGPGLNPYYQENKQINKMTTTNHLTLGRMAIIKKTKANKCWQGCGGKETPKHYL